MLDGLTLTIHQGEHTVILGPNGAGKSVLVNLLTHNERPLARLNGAPPVRVFGEDNWNIFDLRSQLGIVSSALHQRFVAGNSEGRITGQDGGPLDLPEFVRHPALRRGDGRDAGTDRARARDGRRRASGGASARSRCRAARLAG